MPTYKYIPVFYVYFKENSLRIVTVIAGDIEADNHVKEISVAETIVLILEVVDLCAPRFSATKCVSPSGKVLTTLPYHFTHFLRSVMITDEYTFYI